MIRRRFTIAGMLSEGDAKRSPQDEEKVVLQILLLFKDHHQFLLLRYCQVNMAAKSLCTCNHWIFWKICLNTKYFNPKLFSLEGYSAVPFLTHTTEKTRHCYAEGNLHYFSKFTRAAQEINGSTTSVQLAFLPATLTVRMFILPLWDYCNWEE